MAEIDLHTSAVELAAALRSRDLSSVELLDACLAAVDALDGAVNAVVWRDDDSARAEAVAADERLAAGDDNAPFLGVPIPIKDLTPVRGWPVTYGSHGAADGPSAESELCVDRLRDAGFVLACRTNTPEVGTITAAENLRYGITRNPWDLDRSPGGSSGGAGAVTAAGMFPLAHANDGGGSIRIPASCCGLVGLKPSRGRVPRLTQSWLGAVVEGSVTRTVADSAAVLDVLCGHDPLAWYSAPAPQRPFANEVRAQQRPLRIGLMAVPPLGLPYDEETAAGARAAAKILESLGHSVVEVEVPTVSEELIPNFVVLASAGLADYDGVDWSKVEPHIASQHAQAQAASSLDYVSAARVLERMSREIAGLWGGEFDVLLTPTIAIEPPVAGSLLEAVHAAPDAPALPVVQMVSFCAFANVTGQPAISLPLHRTEAGLPIGVQLVGAPFDEAMLLRLAAQLEQAAPWAQLRPAVVAA